MAVVVVASAIVAKSTPLISARYSVFGHVCVFCVKSLRLASSCQVKVRGVRVSLEEVEVLACRAAGLPTGAFAVAYDQGTETSYTGDRTHVDGTTVSATSTPDRGRLVAFFRPSQTSERFDGPKLRLQLAAKMTPSQLPAVVIPVVGEFPLTTAGKVRHRLCVHFPILVFFCLQTLRTPSILVASVPQIGLRGLYYILVQQSR